MQAKTELPFFTLLLMISFASVNAVLFTPALPEMAKFFAISNNTAQQTITWFLVGYAIGQLLYGPLANRFGRKPALYIGIFLQIISSFLCIYAGTIHTFTLLLLGRFLLALGSGVGLKMTFTLVNECYEPKVASTKISYLMLSFAITPGLSVALGGVLTTHYGWLSCFYAGALYGLLLLLLTTRLPETQKILDTHALKLKHLVQGYSTQFKNRQLVTGGFLMGLSTCFVYIFAALAPFIAIDKSNMTSAKYGIASILPPVGLLIGSLLSPWLIKKYSIISLISKGIIIMAIGTLLMLATTLSHLPPLLSLFLPTIIIYIGLCFILSNTSTIAMSHVNDKSHGAAVMSFLNMGTATVAVLSLGFFTIEILFLPITYLILCGAMAILFLSLKTQHATTRITSL